MIDSRGPDKKRFAKRSLGQNFLVDERIIRRIVDSVPDPGNRMVIEIGPGRGALSDHLVARSGAYFAIEKDTDLANELRKKYSERENAEVVESDVLEFDFESITNNFAKKPFIIANLPYNISTPVMKRLATYSSGFDGAVLMLQKEVTERLAARPGDRKRGFLTILTELNFESDLLFHVPPRSFRPVPKVDSAVIRLTPVEEVVVPDVFANLVSIGFGQKRKKLSNNIKQFVSREQFVEWAETESVSENVRPADLTTLEWKSLAVEVERLADEGVVK